MYQEMIHNDAAKMEQKLLERDAPQLWRFSQFKTRESRMFGALCSAVRETLQGVLSARPSVPTAASPVDRRAEA